MKSHYIIFLICILFGLQSPIAAQSSDLVYSPYAQYLTNDTTISPPVGEPADAALSYFRPDTIYVLVMQSGELYIWLRPDPLMDKYINISPYAYCNGNPLKYVDPEGETWTDIDGNIIMDHSDIKMYIFYDPESFAVQTENMYREAEKKYGIGSVAMSSAVTTDDFCMDWENMSSPHILEVNLNYHGNNQTLILNADDGAYITATGDGRTNRYGNPAINVQDLPQPIGSIRFASLFINSCHSNSTSQYKLKGTANTLMEAFYNNFNFYKIRGTQAGVSYNRYTTLPEPQYFWQKWDYFIHYPKSQYHPNR